MLVDIPTLLGGKVEFRFAKWIANMLVMPAQSLLSKQYLEIRLVQSLRASLSLGTKAFSFTFTSERELEPKEYDKIMETCASAERQQHISLFSLHLSILRRTPQFAS